MSSKAMICRRGIVAYLDIQCRRARMSWTLRTQRHFTLSRSEAINKVSMNEADAELHIEQQLRNAGWTLMEDDVCGQRQHRNIFKQVNVSEKANSTRITCSNKPNPTFADYLCYVSEDKPVMVIEAKGAKGSVDQALAEAKDYCGKLDVPVACGTNGSTWKYFHMKDRSELKYDGGIVSGVLSYALAQAFVERSECPLKKEIQKGRRDLLPVFREAHGILREAGILKGEDQLMTFCTVLFLKLFSELPDTTLTDDLLWSRWSAKPAEDLYNHVKHSVLPAVKRDYPSLDLQIKQINQPATLKKLAELLVPLELQDRQIDVKGAAFEFFLEVYQSNGNKRAFGEYYTPRNVVTTMVQLVDPQFGETVYDPFTGSGGILTQAFKHIAERMNPSLLEDKANKERLRSKTVYGREITGNVTLAQMNMILTGDGHSNITRGDSLLESKECWDDARSRGLPFPETVDGQDASLRRDERERIKYKIKQYDVVITNMPFGLHANKDVHAMIGPLMQADSNVACVEHCIQSVKPGGRLCMIVPEGILTGPKYFKLRKYIYESGRVEDIVELPVGMFAPYFSGRSAIIYMYKHKSDCPQADPQTCGVQQKVRYFKISDFRSGTSVEKRERSAEALRRFLTTRGEPNAKDFYDISLSEQTRLVSKPFVQPELAMHPGSEWTRLGEVVEEVKEKFIAHRNQSSGIAKFSLKHKYEGLVESRDKRWPKESKLVPPGAFVYAPQNITSGAIALHKGNNPVAVSNSYVVFKIKESHAAQLDPEYLFQVLQSSYFTQQLRDNQRGTTKRNGILFSFFSQLNVLLPSDVSAHEV